ncbi:MAG TPA: right-handed parallel beta-helix repeat-containing protein [Acidimicrobiales bacterium]|nr:right-handed parallel beta-helix repeat-containing protein [Acidimicrobiales bacterium]
MNFRKGMGVTTAATLLLSGTALVAPAQAATERVECGQNVDHSLTLGNDIGPCTGDGLVVTTSNITINLGGRTITGSNTTNTTNQEQVGIRLVNVQNVKVIGRGTVTNFDAGVAIEGGSGNTVQQVSAVNNINHVTLTGATNPCDFGDGIVLLDSDNNVISRNLTENNGPYDGIGIIGESDNNTVSNNHSLNNRALNQLPNGDAGPCGPFGGGGGATPGPGRRDQNIGIRVEGPGADNNTVSENRVVNNLLNGITVHGHVCQPPPGFPTGPQPANTGNAILRNTVHRNGFGSALQDGISILSQGPLGTVTCPAQQTTIVANTVTESARHGIFVSALSNNNTVSRNLVNNNGADGILVRGPFTVCPFGQSVQGVCQVPRESRPGSLSNTLIGNRGTGNAEHDGHDANPNCDANRWQENLFATVNQPCVAANGGTGTVTPPEGITTGTP